MRSDPIRVTLEAMGAVRARITYANVAATLAVVAALGGSAYATVAVPENSVRSATIRNGQVKAVDLGNAAVSAAKIDNASLTPADVSPSALPGGPPGDQGPPGAKGGTGGTGPAPSGKHLIRFGGDPVIQPGVAFLIMNGNTWTQEAGEAQVAYAYVNTSTPTPNCGAGQFFRLIANLDGGPDMELLVAQQARNELVHVPVSLPAPTSDTPHTLAVKAINGCTAASTISRIDIDVVDLR